jgi:AraC-like DNA-binding protein
MIENLHGLHEVVKFSQNEHIILYHNRDTEDFPPHWHTPFEVILPLSSTYRVVCNIDTFELARDEILIICPGIVHELFAPAYGQRIIFQIYLEAAGAVHDLNAITTMMSPAILLNSDTAPDIYDQIHTLMLAIAADYDDKKPFYTLTIYTRFLQILALIGRKLAGKVPPMYAGSARQKEYTDKFISVCSYITEHCTEDLSLEMVATLAGFSKYHFTRLFKQFTNVPFYRYVNQKRIAHAQMLLIDPAVTITDAALHSGFHSVTAFIRMFKLINNCTPTEFRNMYLDNLPQ